MRRFLVIPLACLPLALPAAAPAAADIEAVWSFSGGQVAFQPDDNGTTFTGTVIRPTTFSECTHPTGERMETEVTLQPDGQWFGFHRYFVSPTDCTPGQNGRAAYRVLTKPDGTRFLRLCTSDPAGPNPQPTIASDGATANASHCSDSDYIGPTDEKPTVSDIVDLPPASTRKRCVSRRSFTIHLREPRGDALESAYVYLNGKRIRARKGDRLTAPINLTGLPKGRYTVRIVAETVLGRTISGTRRYRTCASRRRDGSGRNRL